MMAFNATVYARGKLPDPVVVPTQGEALGRAIPCPRGADLCDRDRHDGRRCYARGPDNNVSGGQLMADTPLTASDYPIAETRPDEVTGNRGKALSSLTMEAVLSGDISMEDLRITPRALEQQAADFQISGSLHARQKL